MSGAARPPAVVSIVGAPDSGKTTLIERLIRELSGRGLEVGTIKHDVHGFEMDREGKDSYRHKHAGAVTSLISSPAQVGMVRDVGRERTVRELVTGYLLHVDVVLTEGYRREDWPKVEVHRVAVCEQPLLGPEDGLIAVLSDGAPDLDLVTLDLDDVAGLADHLVERFALGSTDE